MRLCIMLAATLFIIGYIDAVLATVDGELTRSLGMGTSRRLLRSTTTNKHEGPENEERGAAQTVKFWIWRQIGRSPGSVHEKYFKNMDWKAIVASPNYKVWSDFEKWFNKDKVAAITAAANGATRK
ncbi:unnamed protein product [Phytophthora fragariaefolia]|uniref:Unnamed protein product n=1 Tax=Phytophthora fragariaefolia TaxID=1490495 RepID=A0A9W6XIC8_9STRA|nr:unnamed protein product [Phytophthora fragariaefolia]